jgi:prolyl-tRNA synthetase
MRLSQLLTTREPSNADLLTQAGYTHRLADGLYTLLPLGHRVLERITAIVRHEMADIGAQEVTMPLLQPAQLWERSSGPGETRAASFGTQLFRLLSEREDRLILAPTHEEVATILGAACIHEARDVPRTIYQIQPRFRDQVCSAVGLLQTREFVMADAYSFHADRASLDESYAAIKHAFRRAVALCGVEADVVTADCGAMCGEESEELIAPLPNRGDMAAVRCDLCGYAASLEIARFRRSPLDEEKPLPLEEVPVPDTLSAERVAGLLGRSATKRLTWTPFFAGDRILLVVIPGNLFLNSAKLIKTLASVSIGATDLRLASAEELTRHGANYDWVSLVRTPPSVFVIADEAVRARTNFFLPSARAGHFLINVNCERDFRVDLFADLTVAGDGSACPRCGNELRAICGVEVGHIFKLGSGYSAAFGAQIEKLGSAAQPLEMGCYGLGITRLLAVIVEQRRDTRGIVWPDRVAPYLAIIVPLQGDAGAHGAEQLYQQLSASGLDVLLHDSDATPEEKLRYADLLGIPVKIILSGEARTGDMVEVQERSSSETRLVRTAELCALLHERA